jgi:hypothetical protein
MVISTVNPIVNSTAIATSQIPQCDLAPAENGLPAIAGPMVPAGQNASTFAVEHADSVAFAQENSALLTKVTQNYRIVDAASKGDAAAIGKVIVIFGPTQAAKLITLKPKFDALVNPYACQLGYLSAHQSELASLQANLKVSPHEWQRWFWVDVAGMIVFIPFIFLTKGRWSVKAARRDRDEQEAKVAAELAALGR